MEKTFLYLPKARPRRNIQCIAFTASVALITTMLALGVRVRLDIIDPSHYVAPVEDFTPSQLIELSKHSDFKFLAVTTFLVANPGSNLIFNVPLNWDSSNNIVDTVGAGASGGGASGSFGGCCFVQATSGGGGGGGAWSRQLNVVLVPLGTATYQIGTGGTSINTTNTNGVAGGDTWFNGTTLAGSSCGAKGGSAGQFGFGSGGVGGPGGDQAAGVGSSKFSGGTGAAGIHVQGNGAFIDCNGGGGGGAAGFDGAGGTATGTSTTGGTADNGLDGAGGTLAVAGAAGTKYDAQHGFGGGGGGGNGPSQIAGGAGGLYGGGGGGAYAFSPHAPTTGVSGAGAQGIIRLVNILGTFALHFAGAI